MISILYRNLKEDSLKVLSDFKVGSWVHMEDPTEEEIESVATQLNLDESLMRDGLDPFEVPRIEEEEGQYYVYTRFALKSDDQIITTPLLVIISADHVVTVSRLHFPIADELMKGTTRFFTTQKTKLFILIFLRIMQQYQYLVNDLRKRVRNFSSNLESIGNREVTQFVTVESIFNDFLSALDPTTTTLSKVLSGKYLKLFEEDQELVEDLLLTTNQLIEVSRTHLTLIKNIREAYATIVSNNLNRTMKFLASLTLILTIPTMIASFFGMNVPIPLSDHPQAFLIILMIVAGLSSLLFGIFKQKDMM